MPKKRRTYSVSTREAMRERGRPSAKHKYNAAGQMIDGFWFASSAEAARYMQLRAMQAAGLIEKLETQPSYVILINGKHITTYKADFRYQVFDERGQPGLIIEDVKGMITDVYVLKKKMVEAYYGFKIHEIPARKVLDWAGRFPMAA